MSFKHIFLPVFPKIPMVKDNSNSNERKKLRESLQEGDEVDGKHSACCVRKLSSSKRPERLISKLKAMNLEDDARAGRKIIVSRRPRGPDGTKGFSAKRAH